MSETAHLVIDTVSARIGNFGRVSTDELCVDDICVTRDQFAEVFGNQPAAAGASAIDNEAPDRSSAPSEPSGTDTASTTTPQDSSPAANDPPPEATELPATGAE